MKKKILIICLAILMGIALSFPIFPLKKENTSMTPVTLFVLQTGVFTDYENAVKEKAKVKDSIIYQDGSYFRVLVGASKKEEGLEKIKKVLEEQNIHYYKKEISFLENGKNIEDYNLMLDKVEEKETILLLNKKILEQMEGL